MNPGPPGLALGGDAAGRSGRSIVAPSPGFRPGLLVKGGAGGEHVPPVGAAASRPYALLCRAASRIGTTGSVPSTFRSLMT
jgi:hypothetical protein